MTETVRVTCGGKPQYFNFALPGQVPVLSTTTAIPSAPLFKDGVYESYQAIETGTGSVTGTVIIEGTNDPHTAGADDTTLGTKNNFNINTTSGSATITSPDGYFRSDMDGDEVYAIGVPVGTTMTYVSASSATLSVNATVTATGVQARFQALNWLETALGTITLNGTNKSTNGFSTASSWRWVRARVTAITGTSATAKVIQNS